MMSPSDEERIIAMVDSFTKTVARNFSRNLKRAKANAEKHYSDEPVDYLLETLSHDDRYPSDHFVLYADELSCVVHSETLYKALCSLPEKQRKVLLFDFWYRFVKRLTKEERRKWGYAGVWEISMPEQAGGPQPIPVELPWWCIKMHSDPGGLILDPFCGGGTTLIAAEQSGRRCFAMDSDPLNCDLTVLRWEQFTGEKAQRMKKYV